MEVGGELVSDGLNGVDEVSDVDVFDELSLEVFEGDFPFGVIDVDQGVFGKGVFVCVGPMDVGRLDVCGRGADGGP